MPIRWSSASGSATSALRSATTRTTIPPTARQLTRMRRQTAEREHWLAHHAAWSSKSRVCQAPWRAQGTRATTTPWARQRTRGASASTNACTVPRSSARQRRRPSPQS